MELEKPSASDCCGNGCSPCVFDIYEQYLSSRQENLKNSKSCDECVLRTDLLSKTCFKPFKLVEKCELQEDVFLFSFQAMANIGLKQNPIVELKGILPYEIGQHLFLRCYLKEHLEAIENVNEIKYLSIVGTAKVIANKERENNKSIVRAYTPITIAALEKNCCFSVVAKYYETGVATNFLKQSLIGDILYWRGPGGTYTYKPSSFDYILMTCVGSGLAPMVSIINTILNNEFDETLIHLMFGVKNINNVILRNEIKRMIYYWNFTLEYYFSKPQESNNCLQFGETAKNKRIDYLSIKEYIEGKNLEKLFILVCGTDSFNLDMKNILLELGVNLEKNAHFFY